MKVLHLEENHPALVEGLQALGFQNDLAFEDSLEKISLINLYYQWGLNFKIIHLNLKS